jgi:hypothetical protein
LMRCSISILVTNPAEQHNIVTLKVQRQINWHRETSPVLFDLKRFKVDYHLLPTATSFPGTVCAVPLFYSHTSYCGIFVQGKNCEASRDSRC